MENSSKALIIAGAVLTSILLVATGVQVYNSTGKGLADNAKQASEKMWAGVDFEIGSGEDLGENVEKLATNKAEVATTTLRSQNLFSGTIPNELVENLVFIDSNTHKAKDGALIIEDVGAVKKGEVMAYAYDNDGDNLYEVVVAQPEGVIANSFSFKFLLGAQNLEQANFQYLDTSKVTNMSQMFYRMF